MDSNIVERRNVMRLTLYLAASALLSCGLAGCSSYSSSHVHPDDSNAGLVYFLPKKDVVVTLTVASGQLTGVTLNETTAYPDRSAAFVLNHEANGLAKNVTNFEIKNGLLTSSTGTLTSGVSDALKNLASSRAALTGDRIANQSRENGACNGDGNHTFRLQSASDGSHTLRLPPASARDAACEVEVTIKRLAPANATESTARSATDPTASQRRAGIYYRQLEALLVVAKGHGIDAASILYVPAAPSYFLPTGSSFFANNAVEITLEDGVPTKFKRDADGELVALLKLPADVIGAYFTAIGGVFDAFKNRDAKEVAALQESLRLESAKQKYAVCVAAVKAADNDLVAKLGCDKL
jgi:hypothetical protein